MLFNVFLYFIAVWLKVLLFEYKRSGLCTYTFSMLCISLHKVTHDDVYFMTMSLLEGPT